MAPLLVLLARQTSLNTLHMSYNKLSAAQNNRIRKVVTVNAPECEMEGEIEDTMTEEEEENEQSSMTESSQEGNFEAEMNTANIEEVKEPSSMAAEEEKKEVPSPVPERS